MLCRAKQVALDLNILILIGIAAMLSLAAGVILFVMMYQRRVLKHQLDIELINQQNEIERIQASIQSEEGERMRIATELHDDVGATLASIRLFLYNAEHNEGAIQQSKQLLDESIQKIRNISHKLQPATLQHLGLQVSLQALAEMIGSSNTISVVYENRSALPRMADNIELSVYRVVQELINNILKHAHATELMISTEVVISKLILLIRHNGNGMVQEDYMDNIYKRGAIGLKNIVNRLRSVNANIMFSKDADHYKIIIETPFKPV